MEANSTGPGSVEESAPITTEPHPVTQAESEDDADDGELLEFDPLVQEDFEGLLYLGKLSTKFNWMGHSFQIRTLNVGEVLEVGLIHRAYAQTFSDAKAYQAAVVASCVELVDGQSLPMPISNEKTDTELINKFHYILRSWFPPTLDAIYEQYLLLEARVDKVMKAMGKAPGSTDTVTILTDTSA